MKGCEMEFRHVSCRRSRPRGDSLLVVALTLCLVLGSSLLKGCAVGAALGLVGATTTAGVLVSDTFDRSPNEDEPKFVSVFVKNETEVYTGPGVEYSRVTTLNEGVEIQVLGQRGDWVKCSCDRFKIGWIHHSSLSGT